jgi:hypothetical protein
MDRSQTSNDLLAHFDRPKTLGMPEFDGVDELLADEPASVPIDYFSPSQIPHDEETRPPHTATRGVGWVLQWAAVGAVLFFAAGVLIQLACGLAAEHQLAIAARAGASEATLPRATYQSVIATIERRLACYPRLAKELHVSLEQNGSLLQQQLSQHEDDSFAISLCAPTSSITPGWFRVLTFGGRDSRVQARAESRIPGRKLAVR